MFADWVADRSKPPKKPLHKKPRPAFARDADGLELPSIVSGFEPGATHKAPWTNQ